MLGNRTIVDKCDWKFALERFDIDVINKSVTSKYSWFNDVKELKTFILSAMKAEDIKYGDKDEVINYRCIPFSQETKQPSDKDLIDMFRCGLVELDSQFKPLPRFRFDNMLLEYCGTDLLEDIGIICQSKMDYNKFVEST